MIKRRFLSLLLALCLTTTLLPTAAAEPELAANEPTGEILPAEEQIMQLALTENHSGACGDNLTWSLTTDGVLTISGSGAMTDYDNSSNQAPWRPYATDIRSVVLSDEITHIGSYAFYELICNCNPVYTLTLELPAGVKTVGDYAFYGWRKVEKLIIPEGVTYIGSYAFYLVTSQKGTEDGSAYGTREELYGTLSMPAVWPELGEAAFYQNNFTGDLVVPTGTKDIPAKAFYSNKFTSLTLPEGLNSIGDDAFGGNPFTRIRLPETLPPVVGDDVFRSARLETLVVPEQWTHIPNGMFSYWTKLRSLTLPEGLTSIGNEAFFNCLSLQTVTLPSSLKIIGDYAFMSCESLQSIDLPEGLTHLGEYAFKATGLLRQPAYPTALEYMGGGVYSLCSNLTGTGVFPDTFSYAETDLFYETAITSARIPSTMTKIPNSTFTGCKKLTTLYIPASVTAFEGICLYQATNLTNIYYEGTQEDWDAIEYVSTGYSGTAQTQAVVDKATVHCLGVRRPDRVSGTYNATTAARTLWIFDLDNTTYPVPGGYTITVGDQTYSTGDRHYITIEMSQTDPQDVVVSKEGYCDVVIPGEQVGASNRVMIYKQDSSVPFVQSLLLDKSQGSYVKYANLLHEQQMITPQSASWKDRTLYVKVNWNDHGAGTISLEQSVGKQIMLQDGYNYGIDLSNSFLPGAPVYLVLTAADGTRIEQQVKLGVYTIEQPKIALNLGENSTTATMGEDVDVFSGQSIKVDLKKLLADRLPVSLEIREDCTIVGTIGLKGKDSSSGSSIDNNPFDALNQALDDLNSDIDNDGRSEMMDNLVEQLEQNQLLDGGTQVSIGIDLSAKVIGTFEGYVDENLKPVLKSVKLALIFEGEAKYLQSFIVGAAPMYFEAAVKAALESSLAAQQNLTTGFLDPLEKQPLNFELEISVGAGFGHPDILSGGMKGSGDLQIKFLVPYNTNDTKWTLTAKAAFVGSVAGFIEPEWVIWRSDELVLYENGVYMPVSQASFMSLDRANWVQAPRAYQNQASLFLPESPMSRTVTDGTITDHVFKSNLYPYSVPQIVTYGTANNYLAAFWVDDVATRSDENRTGLYYSTNTGSGWNTPELVWDTGTADFAPTVQVTDGTVYLTWLKAREAYASGAGLDTVTDGLDVAYACIPYGQSYISERKYLNNTDGLDMSPTSVKTADGLAALWIHSPDGVFGDEQALMLSRDWIADDAGNYGTPVTLVEGLNGTDSVTLSADGSQAAYSALENGQRIVWTISTADGTVQRLGNGSKPIYVGNTLWWFDNGVIRSTAGDEVPAAAGSDWFLPLTVSGVKTILTLAPDGTDSESVFASYYTDGWSKPVAIMTTQSHLGDLSAAAHSDGTVRLLANCQTLDENYLVQQADLLYYEVALGTDLSVVSTSYDSMTLIPDTSLDVTVKVENQGSTQCSMYLVRILQNETVLAEQLVDQAPSPGEASFITLSCLLPHVLPDALTVELEPLLETDVNLNNNTAQLNLRLQDVSVEEMVSMVIDEAGTVETVVRVINRGQTSLTNVPVQLLADSADGQEAAEPQTIAALAPGEAATLRFISSASQLPVGTLVYAKAEPADRTAENSLSNDQNFTLVRNLLSEAATGANTLQLYAAAEESEDAVQLYVGVENNTAQQQDGQLCASVYEDGKMVKVVLLQAFSLSANTRLSLEPVHLPAVTEGEVKLFLLDSSCVPLQPVKSIPVPQG